jgi:hypothetical protein
MSDDLRKFVEVMGGVRCICGHLLRRHRRPDPSFKVGALVEKCGACWDCECKGEVGLPDGGEV